MTYKQREEGRGRKRGKWEKAGGRGKEGERGEEDRRVGDRRGNMWRIEEKKREERRR